MLTTKNREQLLRKNAVEISPAFDSVRRNTFRGVHPNVLQKYCQIYRDQVKANSVPLNSQNPRFYLELNEKGDYFLATSNKYKEHLNGFGELHETSSHTLLALSNVDKDLQSTCTIIIKNSCK